MRKPVWIVISIIFISCIFLALGTTPSRTSSQDSAQRPLQPFKITVRSFAQNFRVIDMKIEGPRVRLTLRNDYDKGVTAFSISPSSYYIEPDLYPEMIAPGQTHEESFRLPAGSGSDKIISINAVVFNDGTGDGDTKRVVAIKNYRLGKRLAARWMLPYLQDLLDVPEEQLQQRLRSAKTALRNISSPSEAGKSFDIEAGFKTAIENVLIDIENLEVEARKQRGASHSRNRLIYIKEREQRKLTTVER